MKKLCFFIALTLMLSCLTACSFTSNLSGVGSDKLQSTQKIEDMMTAMAEGRLEDAKALMHSSVAGESEDAIVQMIAFLAGRKVTDMTQISFQVDSTTNLSGSVRQEAVSYAVTLDDGTAIHLSATYLSDKTGAGFAAFQIVLGVV